MNGHHYIKLAEVPDEYWGTSALRTSHVRKTTEDVDRDMLRSFASITVTYPAVYTRDGLLQLCAPLQLSSKSTPRHKKLTSPLNLCSVPIYSNCMSISKILVKLQFNPA
jgi:hypothetical protein